MTRIPSFQFYPADWLNDLKLQTCSMTAQGVLINLMCLMHQSEKYGYLIINGSKPDHKTIIKLLRTHHKTFIKCLNELLLCGALKEDENGVLYCKRMVKDHDLREKRRAAGRLGGNPNLLNQKDNQSGKQKPTPSSSTSSSTSTSNQKGKQNGGSVLKIHKSYLEQISPVNVSSVRSKSNIEKLLKNHPETELLIAVNNYAATIADRDPQFRKDPANFFGPREKYYFDFLPENFNGNRQSANGPRKPQITAENAEVFSNG